MRRYLRKLLEDPSFIGTRGRQAQTRKALVRRSCIAADPNRAGRDKLLMRFDGSRWVRKRERRG